MTHFINGRMTTNYGDERNITIAWPKLKVSVISGDLAQKYLITYYLENWVILFSSN